MHLGGKTMQHFKAIKTRTWFAISLIFSFALVTFGCDTGKLFSDIFASIKSRQSVDKEVPVSNYSCSANCDLLGFTEYEYDSNGNQTKLREYTASGELLDYGESEYDSNGNLIKASHDYNENGELYSYTVYLYKKI